MATMEYEPYGRHPPVAHPPPNVAFDAAPRPAGGYEPTYRGSGAGGGGGAAAGGAGGGGDPMSSIPDEVCEYLRYFRRCVESQNVPEIHNLYEFGFPDLTDRYYRDRFWPDEEKVKGVVGEDSPIFLILYKELYYRYVYAKVQRGPSLEHRYYSYHNYQDLFGHILNCAEPRKLNLPNQWLWDIVDEFVYQFQSFCQYKANPSKRSPEELDDLVHVEREVWNLYPVLNILYSLTKKSQIVDQLAAINRGDNPDDVADDFGRHPLYFKLGYFSLIGLLRLHTLLGDYHQALRSVDQLEFDPKGLYNTVPSCLVTLHYYVGFGHMMMRRYPSAIRTFVNCLLYIQRTRNIMQQQQQRTWQYDVIAKTNDQIYHLVAICLTLQPQRLDEAVHSHLLEKMSEKMNRMQRGELAEFEAAFQFGCPKFLSPTLSVTEGNLAKEPTMQQTRVFMEEVKQQQTNTVLRGYLKLYSTMPLPKLVSFMDVKEDMELVTSLLAYKHKMYNPKKEKPDEEDLEVSDLDFYIDKDMIHVADTKVARRYGEYFVRHIQKLTELNKSLLKSKQVPAEK